MKAFKLTVECESCGELSSCHSQARKSEVEAECPHCNEEGTHTVVDSEAK
jgi:hypothetical protein